MAALVMAPAASASPGHELGGKLDTVAGGRYSKAYIDCYDTTIRGLDRWGCAVDEARLQDRLMNTTYRQLTAKLRGDQLSKLRRQQRAWIAERDRKCRAPNLAFETFDSGRDDTPDPWCVLDMTILRTLLLERESK